MGDCRAAPPSTLASHSTYTYTYTYTYMCIQTEIWLNAFVPVRLEMYTPVCVWAFHPFIHIGIYIGCYLPVWSFPPAAPISSVRRRSLAVWMSSSPSLTSKVPAAHSSCCRW